MSPVVKLTILHYPRCSDRHIFGKVCELKMVDEPATVEVNHIPPPLEIQR